MSNSQKTLKYVPGTIDIANWKCPDPDPEFQAVRDYQLRCNVISPGAGRMYNPQLKQFMGQSLRVRGLVKQSNEVGDLHGLRLRFVEVWAGTWQPLTDCLLVFADRLSHNLHDSVADLECTIGAHNFTHNWTAEQYPIVGYVDTAKPITKNLGFTYTEELAKFANLVSR